MEAIVKGELEVSRFLDTVAELTEQNQVKFLWSLEEYSEEPEDKKLEELIIYNAEMGVKALEKLKTYPYVPEDKHLVQMVKMEKELRKFFAKYGLQDTKASKVLRKFYDSLKDYLKKVEKLSEGYQAQSLSEDLEQFDPNVHYRRSYHKFLTENIKRVKAGLNIKNKPEEWDLDTNTERGEVASLALTDSLRQLTTAKDWSQHRGDLRFNYGLLTRGEMADIVMLSGVERLKERQNKERKEELSTLPKWLGNRIKKRMERI